jgi:hypothetical protein
MALRRVAVKVAAGPPWRLHGGSVSFPGPLELRSSEASRMRPQVHDT